MEKFLFDSSLQILGDDRILNLGA